RQGPGLRIEAVQIPDDGAARVEVLSDVQKAQGIIFAQANVRINMKNDTTLQYALLHVRNAQTPADVQRIFAASRDNIDEVLDRDTMVSLFKAGATYFGVSGATLLIDGANWLAKRAEESGGQLQFSSIPPKFSSAILLGGIQNASPEVKLAIA